MKLKPLLLKTLLSSAIVAMPTTLLASEANLKVAVIKNTADSQQVMKGEYKDVITSLAATQNKAFEENTALCVAYLKSNDVNNSELACSAAIKSAEELKDSHAKVEYLQSISYSNRAVARYLSNDIQGAMHDLVRAKRIDSNAIVKTNTAILSEKVAIADETSLVSYAD